MNGNENENEVSNKDYSNYTLDDINKIDDLKQLRIIYDSTLNELQKINKELIAFEGNSEYIKVNDKHEKENIQNQVNHSNNNNNKSSLNFKRKSKKEENQKCENSIPHEVSKPNALINDNETNNHNHSIHDQRLKINHDIKIKDLIEKKEIEKMNRIFIVNQSFENKIKEISDNFYAETCHYQSKIKSLNEELHSGIMIHDVNLNYLLLKLNDEINEIDSMINNNSDLSRTYDLIDDSEILINQTREIKKMIKNVNLDFELISKVEMNTKARSKSIELKQITKQKMINIKPITHREGNLNSNNALKNINQRYEFDKSIYENNKIENKKIVLTNENDKVEEIIDSSFSFEQEFDTEICNDDEFKINKINCMNIDTEFFDKKNKFLK